MSKIRWMANVNGVVSSLAQATIPVMDRGFLYGDSVYEVFRTYEGVPLFLADHFERLENSASLINMKMTQSRKESFAEIRKTMAKTGASAKDNVYVRYQVTRGDGQVDLHPEPDLDTRYVIIIKALPMWKPEFYARGMDMAVPKVRRNPVSALDPNIKSGNYLNNILALTQARQLGADDCIILNREGFVTEASNSNVWFVVQGQLIAPGTGNLRGLTKKHVHRALKESGVKSEERDIHINELYDATECFVTSATREVMPCATIRLEDGNRLEFPIGGGELTRQARDVFSTYVNSYVGEHVDDALV